MNISRNFDRQEAECVRLCRLMCGKALPYRQDFFKEFRGSASGSRGGASKGNVSLVGKPEAFRTSGGKAALQGGGRFIS